MEVVKNDIENIVDEKEPVQEKIENNDSTAKGDEFAYLNRSEFTGEKFKIEVRGLPKYYGINELKKLITKKLDLNPTKYKTPRPGSPYVFLCFKNEEERIKAKDLLNGYEWKGKKLSSILANPAPDPLVKRRNEMLDLPPAKRQCKTLEETATDLAHLPYEEQLKFKQNAIGEILKQYSFFLKQVFSNRPSWNKKTLSNDEKLPCELLPIKPSPIIDGYRNKCEFSIGKNSNGEKTVGFRLGSYVMGTLCVESVENLKIVSHRMKKVAKTFEKFVQTCKYDPFDPEHQKGYLRQLCVRSTKSNGELMIILGIHPQELKKDEIDEFKKEYVEFFEKGDGAELKVTSIYFQLMPNRLSGVHHEEEHLCGATHITETILGLKFRISPSAFFQINPACAEVLYQTAIDFAAPTEDCTILDICCGTGTIGLCFSKHVTKVIGCDLAAHAIEDAKFNAKQNNIENCEFIAGNAEDVIDNVLRSVDMSCNEVIAIVDPPRAGLPGRVVTKIRNARKIKKLVYIMCSPKSAKKNFEDLMRPCSKILTGNPFKPIKSVGIDMFPHTHNTELIMLFERDEIKINKNLEHKVEEVKNGTEKTEGEPKPDLKGEVKIDSKSDKKMDSNSDQKTDLEGEIQMES